MDNAVGLVMTGGGARGAYQAGVLKRIGEIKRVQARGNPFPIIGGSSAGAINGSALAAGSDDFSSASTTTARLWADLRPSDIFRCDALAQTQNSLTWMLDLSLGGLFGGGNAHSLLDATPLRHFLKKYLDCDRIQDNIKNGHLYAIAISATNYTSGKSYLFIQGRKGHPMWNGGQAVYSRPGTFGPSGSLSAIRNFGTMITRDAAIINPADLKGVVPFSAEYPRPPGSRGSRDNTASIGKPANSGRAALCQKFRAKRTGPSTLGAQARVVAN